MHGWTLASINAGMQSSRPVWSSQRHLPPHGHPPKLYHSLPHLSQPRSTISTLITRLQVCVCVRASLCQCFLKYFYFYMETSSICAAQVDKLRSYVCVIYSFLHFPRLWNLKWYTQVLYDKLCHWPCVIRPPQLYRCQNLPCSQFVASHNVYFTLLLTSILY